jgi:hypothetical protein
MDAREKFGDSWDFGGEVWRFLKILVEKFGDV